MKYSEWYNPVIQKYLNGELTEHGLVNEIFESFEQVSQLQAQQSGEIASCLLDIRWEQQMQSIIDKYPKDSRYLLPILTNDADDRQTYKKLSKRINRHLRQVGEMAQLTIPLTLYVARHSWASIAKQKQIPISVISDALGHDSEKTTLIYLSTLDTSAVDNANSEILAALGKWQSKLSVDKKCVNTQKSSHTPYIICD